MMIPQKLVDKKQELVALIKANSSYNPPPFEFIGTAPFAEASIEKLVSFLENKGIPAVFSITDLPNFRQIPSHIKLQTMLAEGAHIFDAYEKKGSILVNRWTQRMTPTKTLLVLAHESAHALWPFKFQTSGDVSIAEGIAYSVEWEIATMLGVDATDTCALGLAMYAVSDGLQELVQPKVVELTKIIWDVIH